MKTSSSTTTKSIGNKIRKLRQFKGLSQKEFAAELKVSQQAISKIEQSEIVNNETLEKVANILGVTIDTIVNFDDDAAFNNFITHNEVINQRCEVTHNNHSIEKIEELYERLLKSEKDKNELFQKVLNKIK